MNKPFPVSKLTAEQPPLKVRGSLLRRDDITASAVHVIGHLNARGNVTAAELKVSGECRIAGRCTAARTENLGSLRVRSLQAEHIKSAGYLSAAEAIHTLTFFAEGAVRVHSLFSAESLEIRLSSSCTADQLQSNGTLTVKRASRIFNALMGPLRKLNCRYIHGDMVDLEHTAARLVSGKDIVIGPGCEIQEIRYSASLKVDGNAKVGAAIFTLEPEGPAL
ncbi:hypothetical protein C2I18_17530 [Paenibacillus sp. PK3_47]|uniref:hypothetical protein n=1 Tax=Paenibacillus sp. PK3_47 TaxID=2072642 RepID=UPI00201DF24A|nr:hypothetical protein [Paenibacillus sp. PK3_47]UQZ35167.1 hypothetical protein C2I18_17530 [Paenibacillus sp. PK3_47]